MVWVRQARKVVARKLSLGLRCAWEGGVREKRDLKGRGGGGDGVSGSGSEVVAERWQGRCSQRVWGRPLQDCMYCWQCMNSETPTKKTPNCKVLSNISRLCLN